MYPHGKITFKGGIIPAEIYKATLTDEEREYLADPISKSKAAARKLTHARILSKAGQNENGPARDGRHISEAFDVSVSAAERVRKAFTEEGSEAAVSHKAPCGTRHLKSD